MIGVESGSEETMCLPASTQPGGLHCSLAIDPLSKNWPTMRISSKGHRNNAMGN